MINVDQFLSCDYLRIIDMIYYSGCSYRRYDPCIARVGIVGDKYFLLICHVLITFVLDI